MAEFTLDQLPNPALKIVFDNLPTTLAVRTSGTCRTLHRFAFNSSLNPWADIVAAFTGQDIKKFWSFLYFLERIADRVTSLKLHVDVRALDPEILRKIPELSNVLSLDLTANKWLKPRHLGTLLERCPSVINLNLDRCSGLQGQVFEVMHKKFKKGRRLRKFNYNGSSVCSTTSPFVDDFVERLRDVEELGLENSFPWYFNSTAMASLVLEHASTLRTLRLDVDDVCDAYSDAIATCKKLTFLSLKVETVPTNPVHMVAPLKHLPNLEHLHFKIPFAFQDDEFVEEWNSLWAAPPFQLKHLFLGHHCVGAGIRELIATQLKTLKVLVLDSDVDYDFPVGQEFLRLMPLGSPLEALHIWGKWELGEIYSLLYRQRHMRLLWLRSLRIRHFDLDKLQEGVAKEFPHTKMCIYGSMLNQSSRDDNDMVKMAESDPWRCCSKFVFPTAS